MPPDARARTILSHAPARVDFGGGWTDVPPYPAERQGVVCNIAVALRAHVRLTSESGRSESAVGELGADTALAEAALRRAGLEGVTATLRNDFPVSAGLGGSSAAGVAMQAALARWRGTEGDALDRDALAAASRAVEVEDLGIAGGYQDHYAAAYGGALRMDFTAEGVRVRRLALSASTREALERRCAIVYTGESRISGETITAVLDAYRDRVPRVVEALDRMKQLALLQAGALEQGDVDALAMLVREHWLHQAALHPRITTDRIDAIVDAAGRAGALGWKALGASGGGCVLVIAGADAVEPVRAAIGAFGELLPFRIDDAGAVAMDDEVLV